MHRSICGLALGVAALAVSADDARAELPVMGTVAPGIWVDPDGCHHWVADGGIEGFMEGRVHPETGMPVCMPQHTCAVANSDVLFQSNSARLTRAGRDRLEEFFRSGGAFAYAIYGHTDSRASDEYNMSLSQRRASSVADVARSVGAQVAREIGYGERRPVAPNTSAANMQQNRRVEIVCYRSPE